MTIRVLIDCDGVLSNFVAGALRVVERVTGKRYRETDVTRDDFCKALALSYDETRRVHDAIRDSATFCSSLEPYPGAVAAMHDLRALAEVKIVTTPWPKSKTWKDERTDWLVKHFDVRPDDVHHAVDKSGYLGEVFVDDTAKHVWAWLDRWPGRVGIFWRTIHNTAEAVPANAWSISSWPRLISTIEEEIVDRARRGMARAFEGEAPL